MQIKQDSSREIIEFYIEMMVLITICFLLTLVIRMEHGIRLGHLESIQQAVMLVYEITLFTFNMEPMWELGRRRLEQDSMFLVLLYFDQTLILPQILRALL